MQIDHDPEEPKIDRSTFPWWAVFIGVAIAWLWYFYFFDFSWIPLALGGLTGMVFMAWAIEITGNKIPDSWRKRD